MKAAFGSGTVKHSGKWTALIKFIKKDDNIPAYILMAPMLIGFLLFTIYPIFYVLRWSFFDYDGYTTAKFIGIDNFIRLFTRDKS